MFFAVDGAEHIEVVQLFVGKEIQDLPGRTTGGPAVQDSSTDLGKLHL